LILQPRAFIHVFSRQRCAPRTRKRCDVWMCHDERASTRPPRHMDGGTRRPRKRRALVRGGPTRPPRATQPGCGKPAAQTQLRGTTTVPWRGGPTRPHASNPANARSAHGKHTNLSLGGDPQASTFHVGRAVSTTAKVWVDTRARAALRCAAVCLRYSLIPPAKGAGTHVDVGSSYHCLAAGAKRKIVHLLTRNVSWVKKSIYCPTVREHAVRRVHARSPSCSSSSSSSSTA